MKVIIMAICTNAMINIKNVSKQNCEPKLKNDIKNLQLSMPTIGNESRVNHIDNTKVRPV